MNELEYLYKKNKYMKDFILLYKSLPCLWRIKSKAYHNRELRTSAYNVLVKKLKEIDPTADRGAVVRKINSLRSNLRKEKRKVADLAKEGVDYEPKLWYYSLFSFLEGQERSRPGDNETNESEEDDGDVETSNIKREDTTEFEVEYDNEDDDPLQSFEKTQDDESTREMTPPRKVRDFTPPPKRVKKIAKAELAQASSSKIIPDQRLSNTTLQISTPHSIHGGVEDQYDVFGKNVAAKLRDIAFNDNTQRLMAEKIVNDALFLAEMGQLTLAHCSKLHSG